jgi:hypothetical protein
MIERGTTSFVIGPAGTGKTDFGIAHMLRLLEAGEPPESILVLVPQPTLGKPYREAAESVGAAVSVQTLSSIAEEMIALFWPLVAERAGFAHPEWEPVFLNIETTQYVMAGLVREEVRLGVFDAVNVATERIVSQVRDNLIKAAIGGYPFMEVPERLTRAWGDRHSSRPPVYEAAGRIGARFREHCLDNCLLDFSLAVEVFMNHVRVLPEFGDLFTRRFAHLIADNIEEDTPAAHFFIERMWPHFASALLIYDEDGGYRLFQGASPDSAYDLIEICEEEVAFEPDALTLRDALVAEMAGALSQPLPDVMPEGNPLDAVRFITTDYYPEMIEAVIAETARLIEAGTPPGEIAILAPILGDATRFALTEGFDVAGIPYISHRPSRPLREEPQARAILTLTLLAHPEWGLEMPPVDDVAQALAQAIAGLDPVRARLLAGIVYRPNQDFPLTDFDAIAPNVQERVTYAAGNRYADLRAWLLETDPDAPLDLFLSRLFGQILSQPGFGFHTDLNAGHIVAQLVESARNFRVTLHPYEPEVWPGGYDPAAAREYVELFNEGLLGALYAHAWQDEDRIDAIYIAPAHTFLTRNRTVDVQFWLDLGSKAWSERLDQPLTHPYVLQHDYPWGEGDWLWTEAKEIETQRDMLYRVAAGLIRRCRREIVCTMANLGERGFEQRGMMLRAFQTIQRRWTHYEEGEGS